MVTRSGTQQQGLAELLQTQKAEILTMPMLEITAPSSWAALDQALSALSQFQWLLLTSTNAVQYFFRRLTDRGLDLQALAGIEIAVVGEKTRRALADYGLQPALLPMRFDSEGLLKALRPRLQSGAQVLFPRVESGGREELVQSLETWGVIVTQVAAYESRPPATLDPALVNAFTSGQVDVVTFASSKTAQHFADLTRGLPLERVIFAAIGPQTAQTCRERLGRVELEATTYTLEGLVEALITYFTPKS